MTPNPVLGVNLHALGGLAAGSFYIPFKRVRGWAWESYWLVGGVFSWIVAPWIACLATVPDPIGTILSAPTRALGFSYLFGVLWGIGGLTFGLSMRYLGMSLGYAMALGFCAAFGTIIPPIYDRELGGMLATPSGQVTLLGVLVCLSGIAVCGLAGIRKERELSEEQKKETISEFSFVKGLLVATFAGIMSACMAFAIRAGAPIAELAAQRGTTELFRNAPVFVVVLAGGMTTNLIWCVLLNLRNRTGRDYVSAADGCLATNYAFSALAGITWYLQFNFYGMGTTQMGDYDFASWTIHMAFIIVFSNLWGILFREWKSTSTATRALVVAGIVDLVLSTAIVGYGTYLKGLETLAT